MRAWLEHEEPVAGTERQTRIRQALVLVSGAALGAGFAAGLAPLPSTIAVAAFVVSLAAAAARDDAQGGQCDSRAARSTSTC